MPEFIENLRGLRGKLGEIDPSSVEGLEFERYIEIYKIFPVII